MHHQTITAGAAGTPATSTAIAALVGAWQHASVDVYPIEDGDGDGGTAIVVLTTPEGVLTMLGQLWQAADGSAWYADLDLGPRGRESADRFGVAPCDQHAAANALVTAHAEAIRAAHAAALRPYGLWPRSGPAREPGR